MGVDKMWRDAPPTTGLAKKAADNEVLKMRNSWNGIQFLFAQKLGGGGNLGAARTTLLVTAVCNL